MADYSKRIDEMLKELEDMKSRLPEQAYTNLKVAVEKYKPKRRALLEDLLKLLERDDVNPCVNDWSYFCEAARANAPDFIEDALNNIQMPTEAAAIGYRWQLKAIADEAKFYEELGKVNAAVVRDYLTANREGLRAYTQTLDQKWRTIVDEGNKLQSEESKLYKEMLDMTNRILEEFKNHDRTAQEKIRNLGQYPLIVVEKNGGNIADLLGLPEGVGDMAEKLAEWLREKNQSWVENNKTLQGRAANYRALVQAEKGGVLPLFKDTRRQVYEYWDKNNVERAQEWMKRFRQSLESDWVSACPTSGQKDDAKDFYKDALDRMEKHLKAMESIAKEFEEKWNGVFKGALSPKTIDELVDSTSWRVNAETLVSIRTPEIINKIIDNLDGYYEESFEEPLEKLKDKVGNLPGETERKEGLAAIERVKKRVEEAVRARIRSMRNEIGASLRWFEADEIKKTLDRSELESNLE